MTENLIFLFLILGLILLSGFFSITESSIFSLQRYQIELIKKRSKVGNVLESFVKKPASIIATILLADEILNVTITSLISTKLDEVFTGRISEELISVIAILITSIIVLIFCEIIPKTIGVKFSRKLSVIVARPVAILNQVLYPLTLFFDYLSNQLIKVFGVKSETTITNENSAPITSLIDIGEDSGSVKRSESQLIDNFLKLEEIPLSKILTPEPDLLILNSNTSSNEALRLIKEKGFSRIPVYQGDSDNIIGVLYSKDLLNSPSSDFYPLLREPFFVPIQKNAFSLLREMQLMRLHMAIVIDEYGRLEGIVTLDDILEEIFGEIEDETDKENQNIFIANQEVYILGKTKIKEFNETSLFVALRKSGLANITNEIEKSYIDENLGIETIGGFIFTSLGRLPKVGESIINGNIQLIVKEIVDNRITKINLRRISSDD
ncbi:MAG: hemolysin family protein [Thermodesulfobacteriota bacterium]|jgi:putative hemolysin|nr:HlyC/CorC family transporter [Candidatus Dadabacteria bacterium]|tara:strand:- start:9516 stop:10826 length:1311 start_codon:yes stop_codon:yes gene_type:complete